jgi:hypothetical protein
MQKFVVPTALVVVGVIHLLPLVGVFGAGRLNTLYGLSIADADLSILMRHRAVLFGLLGVFLLYAAFRPSLYLLALIAATISVLSFVVLAVTTGGYNDELRRVLIVDAVAVVFLVTGFVGLTFSGARQL